MNEKSLPMNKEEQRAFWTTHIQRWKESHVTQEVYCTQAGISYGSFVHWRSALFPKSKIEKSKLFVPVKIDATQTKSSTQHEFIQIKLTTGHVVYMPIAMDAKQIASLIYYLSTPHD